LFFNKVFFTYFILGSKNNFGYQRETEVLKRKKLKEKNNLYTEEKPKGN
jgi:hypothetical protein